MSEENLNGKAIVTYGRSIISLMIAQSLGRRGVEVIGCDSTTMTVLSFSKFVEKNHVYADPSEDEAAFIDDLVDIARKHKPADGQDYVLIPAFNEGRIIAKHKHRFDGLITVAYPDEQAVAKVATKDAFAKTVEDLGVEAPKTWMPKDTQALADMMDEFSFPVFIKPPDDVGGRGISKIENEAELRKAFDLLTKRYESQQILIQEACEGQDYCYCGLFDDGKRVTGMVYHNISKFPKESGAGVVRETVEAEPFHDIVEKLMEPLGWNGVAEIDFMWDGNPETKPKMIEVNARFWAGLDHSIKSDIDFPYMIYKLFTEGKVTAADGAGKEANIGKTTKLPALSTMAGLESLFSEAIHFDELEEQWPEIKEKVKESHFGEAMDIFRETLQESFTFKEALDFFKVMRRRVKDAEQVSYAEDDPFIGLGVLFVFGYLFRHGKLPPEVKF